MRVIAVAAVIGIAGGAAFAQTPPSVQAPSGPTAPGAQLPAATVNTTPQTTSPRPSAVQLQNTTHRTAAAPVPGRNSFTRNEAAKRIGSAGYANVSDLRKDSQGIWRGTALKDGSPVGVALDYQGNVVSQ